MPRELHDHYFREAKREGYLSRAAYKLIEIDDRRRVLKPGDTVLDCGAAPGSWLQVASKRVGPKGLVIGVDLQPIDAPLPENVRTLVGDLRELDDEELRTAVAPHRMGTSAGACFDVILSDMAPKTTGERLLDHHGSTRLCEVVLDGCPRWLCPGGHLVMKVLEGEAFPDLINRTRTMFETVKPFKPKASRNESTEIYVVARAFMPNSVTRASDTGAQPIRRRPSPGWGS